MRLHLCVLLELNIWLFFLLFVFPITQFYFLLLLLRCLYYTQRKKGVDLSGRRDGEKMEELGKKKCSENILYEKGIFNKKR